MMKKFDIVIVGGSLGGVFAAISIIKTGKSCCIIEECDWIGGQLTSQGVPPDEHDYIEEFGCTKTYREFRDRVRKYYLNLDDLKDEVRLIKHLNPGSGWVGKLCHEPRVSLKVLYDMLHQHASNDKLEIYNNSKVISVKKVDQKLIKLVISRKGEELEIEGDFFLDATDTGEFLPLSDTEYVVGSENTSEASSTKILEPDDVQAITWVAAIEYDEKKCHHMEKPKFYDYFRSLKAPYDDNDILSWYFQDPKTGRKRLYGMFGWKVDEKTNLVIPPLFNYRQIINKDYYKTKVNNVTLVNWGQNDYYLGSIYGSDGNYHKQMAKELTKSLIYWLKTEAPRHDGGIGYPEINLRPDILGTADGLAEAPYIRESRRIKALYTVKEEDISVEANTCIPRFYDSIGIGHYKIDIHTTTKSHRTLFKEIWPFEIPLGSIIPIKTINLLAASKNIGTTQITNGCYRLHPIEANIGEAAGLFASFCLDLNLNPKQVYENIELIKDFQKKLEENGVELHWIEDQIRENNKKSL